MQRALSIAVLTGLMLGRACLAAEPTLCTSTCDSERRVCKVKAIELAENDKAYPVERYRHSLASNAMKLQSPSSAEQAIERSRMQTSRVRHAGACDDSHARCTRACTIAAPPQTPNQLP